MVIKNLMLTKNFVRPSSNNQHLNTKETEKNSKRLLRSTRNTGIWQLTLSWRKPLSYRNQSIDLLCKSMDWFLCDNGFRQVRVTRHRERKLQCFDNFETSNNSKLFPNRCKPYFSNKYFHSDSKIIFIVKEKTKLVNWLENNVI